MNLSTLQQLFRTVRHLRFSQVTARAVRLGRQKIRIDQPRRSERIDIAADFPAIPEFPHPCAAGERLVASLESGELPLLNQSLTLGTGAPDWHLGPVAAHRLQVITLHYHQWLYELAKLSQATGQLAERAEQLFGGYLQDWLERCTPEDPAARSLAWNSYAIATRLAWSIRALVLFRGGRSPRDKFLQNAWTASLWRQAACLHQNLEWDLRANHLLRDAVGLAWAGRYFEGREPDRWLRTASRLAVSQAAEQMLPDGGHFERSPFYHLEVMDDWLSLALLLNDPEVSRLMRTTWQRAADFACWMRHPDGRVPQFNDGAAAVADKHLSVGSGMGFAVDLTPLRGGRHLADSGFAVWHGPRWSVFFDVGAIGPDCQPGHAHADTLTLECSYAGRRLFVDPGCHSYDFDARRRYDRCTDSHNTVCIDGVDSSEVWHIFRVGRRARPRNVRVEAGSEGLLASAGHTGWQHLPGRPFHHREIAVDERSGLRITDRISGRREHHISGGFLLDPGWQVEPVPGGWRLRQADVQLAVRLQSPRAIRLEVQRRPVHPDYGTEQITNRLAWHVNGGLPVQVEVLVRPIGEGS